MKYVFVCAFFLLLAKLVKAQDIDKVKQYSTVLDSFYQLSPLEKAYLHCDKDWYTAGETIWFKTYITVDNQATLLSKVFYVDLINDKDSVVVKTMWKAQANGFSGDISLSTSMLSGKYRLRVYSLWMLNTPQVIEDKWLTILSPLPEPQPAKTNLTTIAQPYRIQLFPEGGRLIAQVPNRLAYLITDHNGWPVHQAKVNITDESGNALVQDTIFQKGMGTLTFQPESGKKYRFSALINGTRYIPEFPTIEKEGIALSVNPINPNRIFYTLYKGENSPNTDCWLLAQLNGQVFYAEKIRLEDAQIGGAIPTKNLPHGVVNITLFNASMVPIAERIVFVSKIKPQVPEILLEQKGLGVKEKNLLKVILPSDSAQVSISVKATEQIPGVWTNANIADYFLFRSEIKGMIHEPSFYFEKDDSVHRAALDLLMQTHGWRRIEWKEVISGKLSPIQYFIETGISLQGKAKDTKTLLPPQLGAKVNLVLKGDDSTSIIAEGPITKEGDFLFNELDFRKRGTAFFKGVNMNTTRGLEVKINPNYIDTLTWQRSIGIPRAQSSWFTADENTQKTLLRNFYESRFGLDNGTTLKDVTVYTKTKTREQKLTDEYVSDWYKNSDFTLVPDSLSGYSSVWQWLQGQIPGLNISGDAFNPKVNFSRFSGGITDPSLLSETIYETLNTVDGEVKSSIAFFINEMPVSIEQVSTLSPKDIAVLKVNRMPNVVSNATAGSMFIYTKKNQGYKSIPGMERSVLTGYSVAKTYFTPVYDTPESRNILDKRSSLYWNPQVKIVGKQTTIQFYNSDAVKKYTIIVEGLDKNGIPIRAEKRIE